MTPEDLARVTEWERLAEASTPGPWCAFNGAINSWKQDERGEAIVGCMGEVVIGCGRVDCAKPRMADAAFIAAARAAVPEMARMLREALDAVDEGFRLGEGDLAEIALLVAERDNWREVAMAWEERAHAAMRLADVAAAELKRMREHGIPVPGEDLARDGGT